METQDTHSPYVEHKDLKVIFVADNSFSIRWEKAKDKVTPAWGIRYVVGLKENSTSPFVAIGAGEGQIQYNTKMLFNNAADVKGDGSCMRDFGSYYAGYVTITVPHVTERKEMYVGATLVYKEPKNEWYMKLVPDTRSICKNGAVTLYPSAEVASVEHVYDNNDEGAHMRVSRQAGQLVVTGAKAGQQVRLYQASGVIMARRQADENGRVAFTAPAMSGVGLVSSDHEWRRLGIVRPGNRQVHLLNSRLKEYERYEKHSIDYGLLAVGGHGRYGTERPWPLGRVDIIVAEG